MVGGDHSDGVPHNPPMRLLLALLLLVSTTWAAAATWFDGTHPTAQAREAVALLTDAPSHGLDPKDYGAAELSRALDDGTPPERLAPLLDASLQRFLHDLHFGRIDPRIIHHGFRPLRRTPFDAAAALQRALAAGRIADAV